LLKSLLNVKYPVEIPLPGDAALLPAADRASVALLSLALLGGVAETWRCDELRELVRQQAADWGTLEAEEAESEEAERGAERGAEGRGVDAGPHSLADGWEAATAAFDRQTVGDTKSSLGDGKELAG
jgi:hypothetical protein